MKIPSIRFYIPEDYEGVAELLRDHDYRVPEDPEELNGIGLVAHDEDGNLIGHVWSLVAQGVPVAYTDHFVVHRDHRKSGGVGLYLLLTLIKVLEGYGIKRILGVVPPGNAGYLKMLRKRKVGIFPNYAAIVVNPGSRAE